MIQDIHKKALLCTLQESKIKVRRITKKLMIITMLIILTLLALTFIYINIWYATAVLFICFYTAYLCFNILSLWQKRKQIKQRLLYDK